MVNALISINLAQSFALYFVWNLIKSCSAFHKIMSPLTTPMLISELVIQHIYIGLYLEFSHSQWFYIQV